jgi:hypothetical protein
LENFLEIELGVRITLNRLTNVRDGCIGLVHKFVLFLTRPNNLFFTHVIKQSINYIFSSVIHDCFPTFGQVFHPTLEEIRRFARDEIFEPVLELSIVVEGNSAQIVGERAEEVVIRWDKLRINGRCGGNSQLSS